MNTINTVIVFILAIFAIPLAMIGITFFLFCGGLSWFYKKIKNFFFWFFDPNFIFKDDYENEHEHEHDHRRGGFGNYNVWGNADVRLPERKNVRYKVNKLDTGDQPYHHYHQWECCSSTKHNWYVNNGIPTGDCLRIDRVAQEITENPEHTDTKLNEILTWKARGADIVHTSWNHWRCRVAGCNQTKKTEYYAAPCKSDGQLVIDLNDINNFKPQVISLPVRREIAVEKMKKYS